MRAIICAILLLSTSVYSQWVKQNPLNAERGLFAIDFINNSTGWAAGDSGTIIKTTNSGDNWIYQNLASNVILFSIKFINESTGFVCGDSGRILVTSNGGSNWNYQNSDRNKRLFKISFVNQTTGFCTGQGCIIKTTNAGINWNPNYVNEYANFFGLFFINEQTGWVGGGSQPYHNMFKTTNCGLTWDTLLYTGQNNFPTQIFFINDLTGWVVYPYSSSYVSQTTNGGASWSNYGAGYNIQGLSFINTQTGWGIGNRILKSTNGGVNWTILDNFAFGNSILFKGNNTGYIAGTTGMMIKTTNSGLNWMLNPPEIHSSLFDVKFLNSNTGYASGVSGTFIKTTNAGLNWIRKKTHILSGLYHFHFENENVGWAVGEQGIILYTINGGENWTIQNSGSSKVIYDVNFSDGNTGWVTGDSGLVLKTTNSGINWILQQSGVSKSLWKVFPLNSNKIFILGAGTFLNSTNGGQNWFDRSNDTSTSNWYLDMFFLNDFTGWYTKTGNDRLYKTTDSGDNWQLIPNDLWGFSIEDIHFFNENTGYGVHGFQFKTTNGGTNWINKEISLTLPINSMDFIDINIGWAVGDLGEIYKTTNGGLIPVSNISSEIPKSFALYQNYPNPFNPTTKIKFQIPLLRGVSAGLGVFVRLIIYDILGREIAVLLNEQLKPGTYSVTWDASGFPSGVYFYKLETDGFSESKKMVMIK